MPENRPRFARMVLLFDCKDFILRTIDNSAPFLEKIFVVYSPLPWTAYNEKARENFKNPTDPSILSESKYFDKIELITGEWETDEEQRNACLKVAQAQGFDFLIIQDADEFYLPEAYIKNLNDIIQNPNYSCYQVPWILFWKNKDYALVYREHKGVKNTQIVTCPLFAINLKTNVHFTSRRIVNTLDVSAYQLNGICFHFSWVLSDEQVLSKISTWGHSKQVNINKWYRRKWLGWHENMKNLGALSSSEILKAEKYSGILPNELKNFPKLKQAYQPLNFFETVQMQIEDIINLFYNTLKKVLRNLKNIIFRFSFRLK